MIKIGVCDDNQQFVGTVTTYLDKLSNLYHYEIEVEAYASGEELVDDMRNGVSFDLIYLDIEMNGMDGIETASWIRRNDYHLLLVYISSHEEYLKKLFETEPFRFLQKPLLYPEFEAVFRKAVKRIEQKQSSYYYFHSRKSLIKVLCKDILYFESSGRKIIVHTMHATYEYYDKLNNVEEKVKGMRFIRIHKAYLVNIDNIEAFQYERVALVDGTILSISEKNRPRIRSEFWMYCKGEDKDG